MNWYWFVIALTIGKQGKSPKKTSCNYGFNVEQGSGTLEVIEHALKPLKLKCLS
jgi:hypothetical protein